MTALGPLPVAFFGHGSPTNTLARNAYTNAWRAYAATLPRPRAVAVISAHWYVPGTRVTAAAAPLTIHDFNARFPPELFAFRYPARSDAGVVERIAELLAAAPARRDATGWGIDHGAYSVLAHLFPQADVPIVQVAIDRTRPPAYHYALAQRLAPLRDEGVLVIASGNIVHNLELADFGTPAAPPAWAPRFDERVAALIDAGEHERLVAYRQLGDDARLAIPTPDHYLPLLYILALRRPGDRVAPIVDGVMQTLSMRSFGAGFVSVADDEPVAAVSAADGAARTLHVGCAALDLRLRDLIRAYAPANPAYERERIIAQCAAPRELAYVLGLLSEGENECVLLLDLMHAVLVEDPHADVTHLADEAWYYLRTSIDERWQLDDGPPSIAAALTYLDEVLRDRLAMLRARPPAEPLAGPAQPERAARLRTLRAAARVRELD